MGPDILFEYMLESKDIHHCFYSQLNMCEKIRMRNLTLNFKQIKIFLLTFFTNSIRITLIPWFAITNCTMPCHPAFSIYSTSCGEARVLAFFTNTCKVVRTFWVSCAFRSRCWKDVKVVHSCLFEWYSQSDFNIQVHSEIPERLH